MRADTPAWKLKVSDDQANAGAYAVLLNRAPKPSRVVELFGGVGLTTGVIRGLWPKVRLDTHDLDTHCIEELRRQGAATNVIQTDSLANAAITKDCGIVADFNLLTLGNYPAQYETAFNRMLGSRLPQWICFTDSAVGKIHLNWARYGLKCPSIALYVKGWNRVLKQWGYQVIDFIRPHHRAMVLYARREERHG